MLLQHGKATSSAFLKLCSSGRGASVLVAPPFEPQQYSRSVIYPYAELERQSSSSDEFSGN